MSGSHEAEYEYRRQAYQAADALEKIVELLTAQADRTVPAAVDPQETWRECALRAQKAEARVKELEGGGWISVADRLPDTDKTVLIHAPSADPDKPLIHMAYYNAAAEKWFGLVEMWVEAITHWMPMPKAPVTP